MVFQPSPFAVPVGSFQAPVPLPQTDPTQGQLFYVGINCEWMPYVAGALSQLQLQTTWATTDPTALADVQNRAAMLIALFNCAILPTIEQLCGSDILGQGGEDMCNCLRFNNGVLQTLVCGVWTDVPGQAPGGINAPGQPGGESPQPAPGGCAVYDGKLHAGDFWLLPTPVNTGDVLSLVSFDGATSDLPFPGRWNCPDGKHFELGHCYTTYAYDGSAYLPATPVGRLLWLINGVYYDATEPLTVAGGVTNLNAALILNYPISGTFNGDISFTVQRCNNAPATWSHTFDFSIAQYGWSPNRNLSTDLHNYCVYTPGTGFTSVEVSLPPDNVVSAACYIPVPSTFAGIITDGDVYYELVVSDSSRLGEWDWVYTSNTAWDADTFAPGYPGPQIHSASNAMSRACTFVSVAINCVREPGSFPTSHATITKIVLRGTGTDPF
jgi:hypothetical protein